MKKEIKTTLTILLPILILGGLFFVGSNAASNNKNSIRNDGGGEQLLASVERAFNFGEISMAKGTVEHLFEVRNISNKPVVITKMYTSCMCTSAYLNRGTEKFGPFGMPGHGAIPSINKRIEAGESVAVNVIFDPQAHGPAGVGRIDRTVFMETEGGNTLEVGISAFVTP